MRRAGLRQARRAAVLCHPSAAAPTSALMCDPSSSTEMGRVLAGHCQQQRGLQLFEIFSKENRAKRKKRLQEDLERGYFDDFKELKDTAGKLWRSPDRPIPAEAAQPFPPIKVVRPDKVATTFPHAPDRAPHAQLVCIGFKDGAEDMLATWSDPFVEMFRDDSDAGLVELSVVESQVMALWPFRNMILAAPRRAASAAAATDSSSGPGASPTEQAIASTADGGDAAAADAATAEASAGPQQGRTQQSSSEDGGGAAGTEADAGGDGASGSSGSRGKGASGGGGGGIPNGGVGSSNGNSGIDGSDGDGSAGGAPITTGDAPVIGSRSRVGRLHSEYLFYFGDAYDVCRALHISNRLTGYAFLLDRSGRVRFRGCGKAEAGERDTLLAAARQLVDAQGR